MVADGDELSRLLAVAPFTMPKVERSRPTLDAARVWVTLLSLFSGARLNELAGLQTDDLKREGGIAYLNIVEGKTDAATRRVPLHPTLTALGFAKYAAALPPARCFPRSSPTARATMATVSASGLHSTAAPRLARPRIRPISLTRLAKIVSKIRYPGLKLAAAKA